MTTPLTRDLAAFVSQLRYEDIPPDAVKVVHTGFADCVGVMLAGAMEPAPQLLQTVLAPPPGEATLLFGQGTAPAPEAAWINGTAAHALDFDDVALKGHPSTVLVPAILAEAQTLGASGRDMVTAYAAGYETWAELVRRDRGKHQGKGWHPTGIFGSIAAAAACASLRKLEAQQAAMAISIGASQSGGLTANFGTMTKPFHAGRAAHSGIIAARLARAGFSASPNALEHSPGFLMAVSPDGLLDLDSPIHAGGRWKLESEGLDIKKYPLCFAVHTFVDGVFDLMASHDLDAENVIGVETFIRRRHAIVLRYPAPATALEAKFSMPFAIACAMIVRRVGLTELDDELVRRSDIQAFMKRVSMTPDEREAVPPPPGTFADRVIVELEDGRRLDTGPITRARGTHDLPLSSAELWMKFESCVIAGIQKRSVTSQATRIEPRALFDALMSLERIKHVREIPGLA
jgi:2-methylcitrate dehydratase PrpD